MIVARGVPTSRASLPMGSYAAADTHATVHWHGCPDASLPTPKQAWWPLYRNSRGDLRPSQLPPARQKAEIYEVDRDRVLYQRRRLSHAFPTLSSRSSKRMRDAGSYSRKRSLPIFACDIEH